MPRIPVQRKFTLQTPNILNAIKNQASVNYQDMVPYADESLQSVRAIGNILTQNPNLANEAIAALFNRIALIYISSRNFYNPLRFFKKGYIELGETIEEVFVELIEPEQFNPEEAANTVFKRRPPDVRSQFHLMNYQIDYPVTIDDKRLKTAFLSWSGVADLIAHIISRCYTSNSYDEFLVIKYALALRIIRGQMNVMEIPTISAANIEEIAVVLKQASNDLTLMSTNNNLAGVHNSVETFNQFLLQSSEFNARMNVQVLANAFNIDRAEFLGHNLMIGSFGDLDIPRLNKLLGGMPGYYQFSQAELAALKSIPAVLVSENFFMIFDNLEMFTTNYNGNGLYWNYFYHVWKTISTSMFAPNMVFVTGTPAVTEVTLSPAQATVNIGQNLQLTIEVATQNFAPKSVDFTSSNENVTVTPQGLISVLPGATGIANITATSVFDPTKTATCTITIGS